MSAALSRARRPHQRRVPKFRFGGVHARTTLDEQPHRSAFTSAHRRHQQRVTGRIGGVDVGAGIEQTPQDRGVALLRCDVDRRHPEGIRRRDLRTAADQQISGGEVSGPHRVVQRCGSVGIGLVDVGVPRDQRPHGRRVGTSGGLQETLPGRGSRGVPEQYQASKRMVTANFRISAV